MYIKAEIKIKQIKIINCRNYSKNIVFEIEIKYNKSILFRRKSFGKEGFIYELPRFDLAFS